MTRVGIVVKIWFSIIVFTLCALSNAEVAPLQFDVVTTRSVFISGEPIVMKLSIKNILDNPINVAEPLVREGFVKITILQDSKKIRDASLVWDIEMPASDYKMRLEPGGITSIYWSLMERYPLGLSIGNYVMNCEYDTRTISAKYPGVWHGSLRKEIGFSIVAPGAEEKRPYELIRMATEILAQHKKGEYEIARVSLRNIVNQFPYSRYAAYASYLIAKSYLLEQSDGSHNYKQAIMEYESFIMKYPEYMYYSTQALLVELPFALCQEQRYTEALYEINKSPYGYYKQRILQGIDRKLNRKYGN